MKNDYIIELIDNKFRELKKQGIPRDRALHMIDEQFYPFDLSNPTSKNKRYAKQDRQWQKILTDYRKDLIRVEKWNETMKA